MSWLGTGRAVLPLMAAGLGACELAEVNLGHWQAGAQSDAGVDASAASAGAAGAGGAAAVVPPPSQRSPCLQRPSQRVLLGDGYISSGSNPFPASLAQVTGMSFRNEVGLAASWMVNAPRSQTIPQVYANAVARDGDILAVIMSGGGDDIFFPAPDDVGALETQIACNSAGGARDVQACQDMVGAVVSAAAELFDSMASDGVQDVIYLGYPRMPSGVGGANRTPVFDLFLERMRGLCVDTETRSAGKLRCQYVDLIPVFDGHSDWFAGPQNYYPNAVGASAMANAVAHVLSEACIGQPANSGCCH